LGLLNKFVQIMPRQRAFRELTWREKLRHPRHLGPSHTKLLDDLYVKVQKKKRMITDPYEEAIQMYDHLYPDGYGSSLIWKERGILVQAEKPQKGINVLDELGTINTQALGLC